MRNKLSGLVSDAPRRHLFQERGKCETGVMVVLFVDVWAAWVEAGYLVNNNTHDTLINGPGCTGN